MASNASPILRDVLKGRSSGIEATSDGVGNNPQCPQDDPDFDDEIEDLRIHGNLGYIRMAKRCYENRTGLVGTHVAHRSRECRKPLRLSDQPVGSENVENPLGYHTGQN